VLRSVGKTLCWARWRNFLGTIQASGIFMGYASCLKRTLKDGQPFEVNAQIKTVLTLPLHNFLHKANGRFRLMGARLVNCKRAARNNFRSTKVFNKSQARDPFLQLDGDHGGSADSAMSLSISPWSPTLAHTFAILSHGNLLLSHGDRVKLVRSEFRKKFPKASNCTNVEAEPKPWSYGDRDIKLIKTYSNQKGWLLVLAKLNDYRCDGMIEGPFGDQWFTISPTKNVRFLDSDMWLVDAGDYDNDGKSEVLFAIAGDNRGGYRLFYDDFKKQAVFEYSYH
jgi:hypothetical protein